MLDLPFSSLPKAHLFDSAGSLLVSWLYLQYLIPAFNGLVELLCIQVCYAQLEQRWNVIWLRLQCLLEALYCFVVFPPDE